MATNYPGALDSLTNPGAGDALDSPSHAGQHANANDAIEAVQGELGTDPAGASATVKARFEVIEANDWVTSARIAADAVGSSEIAANAVGSSELADNAVDTAAIANGAVTAAKILIGAATVGSGTGTPEGVVTAAPGSTWLQIGDAVTVSGNLLWRKVSGTGNTGWVPEGALADTGWREVTNEKASYWDVQSRFTIRRQGSFVTVLGRMTTTAGGSGWAGVLYTLPDGFRMTDYGTKGFGTATSDGVEYLVHFSSISSTTSFELYSDGAPASLAAGAYLVFEVSFSVNDSTAWPSSLPGAAV